MVIILFRDHENIHEKILRTLKVVKKIKMPWLLNGTKFKELFIRLEKKLKKKKNFFLVVTTFTTYCQRYYK